MEKFSESIDPDKLPVPLVPPLPLIPRRPESGLGRHRSVPDISQLSDPDKDGWYWSKEWTTVKNIQSQAKRSEPIVDKKQLLDIENILNSNETNRLNSNYDWGVELVDPQSCDPTRTQQVEGARLGRPETKEKIKDRLRKVFRSKSPKNRESGAVPKFQHDSNHYMEVGDFGDKHNEEKRRQIIEDRSMAEALNKSLERERDNREETISQSERDALRRDERDLMMMREDMERKKRREREHERVEFERRRERVQKEKDSLKRGMQKEKRDRREDRISSEREKGSRKWHTRKEKRQEPTSRHKEYETYSSYNDDRSVSPRNRHNVYSDTSQKVHRKRGDTVLAISINDRNCNVDSSSTDTDAELTVQDLAREIKSIKADSAKTIHIPTLDLVPYPSDKYVGDNKTNNNRAMGGFYKQHESNRNFARKPNEDIIRYLNRVKRAIEGTKFNMDSRQFIDFTIRFLDEQSSNFFHETFEVFENFNKYQFLDYVVASVTDNKEKGEVNAAFWSYDPKYDSGVKNPMTLLTKLSQLMARTDFTISDLVDKIIVLLPSEFVAKIKKHRNSSSTGTVALDVVLFELNKFEKEISEYLMKRKEKRQQTSVRSVRHVEVDDDVGADGDVVELDNEHAPNLNNEEDHVFYVPYRRLPERKEDLNPNQFLAKQHSQQQQHNISSGVVGQKYPPVQKYPPGNQYRPPQKQIVCPICFKYGHSEGQCRMVKYCAMCNSTSHIAPQCDVYMGVAPVTDDCPSCLSLFSLRLKHSFEVCRLNENSPFSIAKTMTFNPNTKEPKSGE